MSDLISRADAISVLDNFTQTDTLGHTPRQIVEALPSAQPEQIARDIATVIENEKDMRVILKNAQPDKKEEWKMRFVLKDVRAVEIEGNKVNLCDSCMHEYPTCDSGPNDALFGDGKGNDNVCCCSCYKPLQSKQREVKE